MVSAYQPILMTWYYDVKYAKMLVVIQDEVKEYKVDKEFTGLPVEVQLALESLKESNRNIIETTTQLSLAEWVENELKSDSGKDDVIPSSLGIDNPAITNAIEKYNLLILERKRLKVSAGVQNPVLIQIEDQIVSARKSLFSSLANVRKSLDFKLKDLKKEEDKVLSKVKSIPSNERGFIDIARQQEIISGLYQYLLKKKEETDISLAVTVPNAKIIDIRTAAEITADAELDALPEVEDEWDPFEES